MVERITIQDAPHNPYLKVCVEYDYQHEKCKCPVCGGLGSPWRGWFQCEDCRALAVVRTGDTYIPADDKPAPAGGGET